MKTKKSKPGHTPTPWHRNVSPADKYPIYADKNGNANGRDWIKIAAILPGNPNGEADLDFILRAVNSHEELIDTMRAILDFTVKHDLGPVSPIKDLAIAALKAAGEKI